MVKTIYPVEYFDSDASYEIAVDGYVINCILAVLSFVSDIVYTFDVDLPTQATIKDICDRAVAVGFSTALQEGRHIEKTYLS